MDAELRAALLAVLDRDLDRAEEHLTRAVRMDPNGVEPYVALGRFYRMRGDVARAIGIQQAMLVRPDLGYEERTRALADLGADFRQGGFLRRAIASYEEVVSRDAHHLPALRALARLLAQVREYPRALQVVRRLAKLEKRRGREDEARLLLEMAEAAQAEGRSEEALRAVRRALRCDPASIRSWVLLGSLEAERGRDKAALAAWAKVPKLDRRLGGSVYPRIEATYAALDRTREYEAFLRGLLEERPDDAGARLALARHLAARGDVGEAVSELERVLEVEPDDLGARETLGRLLLAESRDTADAYAALLDALERRGLLRPREDLA